MSLRWAAHMAKAAGIPGATVLVLLHYMAWKARSLTFPLSNTLLTKYGVDLDKRIEGGERYVDSRPMAMKMWSTIMGTVEAIGALPKKRGVG